MTWLLLLGVFFSAVAFLLAKLSGRNVQLALHYRQAWLRAVVGHWLANRRVPYRIASALAPPAGSTAPPLPTTSELVAWVESFIRRDASSSPSRKLIRVEVSRDRLGGGHIGSMFRLNLTWEDDQDIAPEESSDDKARQYPRSLVVKTLAPAFRSRLSYTLLGSAREAYFYQSRLVQRPEVGAVVPYTYHTYASWLTGDYALVMEDLARTGKVRLGSHVLGNQCWGPVPGFPAELQTEEVGLRMLEEVFTAMADVHAAFWRDASLLSDDQAESRWLKGVGWLRGRDRLRWEFAMEAMRTKWTSIKRDIGRGATGIRWSEEVMRAMDASLGVTSWETFRQGFDVSKATTPFTLCHGDFHAANVLWLPGEEGHQQQPSSKVYMVDWPEVGVFCPFTEVAQFVISNAPIDMRRRHERRLFESYHARLVEKGVCGKTFSLEACWTRYVRGGIERWLQMLILLATLGLPDNSVTWFQDQVAAFLHDHAHHLGGEGTPFMTAYVMAL